MMSRPTKLGVRHPQTRYLTGGAKQQPLSHVLETNGQSKFNETFESLTGRILSTTAHDDGDDNSKQGVTSANERLAAIFLLVHMYLCRPSTPRGGHPQEGNWTTE